MSNQEFSSMGQIFQAKKKTAVKKPPAHQWQDMALAIIKDLAIPAAKRNSVFRVCKQYSPEAVQRAFNDTKELCPTGDKWKYFFKIINNEQAAYNKNSITKKPEPKGYS